MIDCIRYLREAGVRRYPALLEDQRARTAADHRGCRGSGNKNATAHRAIPEIGGTHASERDLAFLRSLRRGIRRTP
jgi:hypothetical protein